MPRLSKIGAAALAAFGWTGLQSVTASYLVVAGAGGGGGSTAGGVGCGGGGAGGYQTGTTSLNPTLSYTITVGAGGAGGAIGGNNGVAGSNSQLGSLTASVGGGYGAGSVSNGGSGGSGGGATYNGGTGGSATSGQGNAGGNDGSNAEAGGGGGGAGAAGSPSSGTGNGSSGGNGGNGTSNSITGTSVTYAGGGGGGASTSGTNGTGGTGGGANGGQSSSAGTANLGGGGGGAQRNGAIAYAGGNGGSGVVIISYPAPQQFGGGVVTTSGSNVIHTFSTSGTLSPLSSLTASYLIVAGGGGGTRATGVGGSGAGGFRTGSGLTIDSNSIYLVTVGAGGAGATSDGATGASGGDSFFWSTTSSGGGAGGRYGFPSVPGGNGVAGGSGGGSDSQVASTGGAGNTPSTSPSQGNNGGVGGSSPNSTAGGGGGAGAVGGNGTTTVGGAGGIGATSSISGTSTYYAGGGGGGAGAGYTGGTGGTGGGGNGGVDSGANGTSGTANTGGGAGGNRYAATAASNGGSGVVIISYAGATQQMAGGTVTITGGNVIHTFTSSGYLTPIKLVNNSLRFRASATAYLNRTPPVASNRKTWTWSGWVKRGVFGGSQMLFDEYSAASDNNVFTVYFTSSNTLTINGYSSSWRETTQVFRDPAAWYHIVIVLDTTQATANNRVKLYVNGVEVTSFSTTTNPTLNDDLGINQAATHTIGKYANGSLYYFDGYLTEINFIDGQALTPNSFGTFNSYGVWQPITYGGSYGTNGFYLPFTNTTSATTLAYDFSPNGNNWTPNNISTTAGVTYDSMTDVPTLTSATAGNYCTWNPLWKQGGTTAGTWSKDGNLNAQADTNTSMVVYGTMKLGIGNKIYSEFTMTNVVDNADAIGIVSDVDQTTGTVDSGTCVMYRVDGQKNVNGTVSAYGASYTDGDVIGVAVDLSANSVTFYKNNTSQGAITGITAVDYLHRVRFNNVAGQQAQCIANWGQRPFTYTPPTGFVALNTYNL